MKTQNMPVIILEASAYQRGFNYGEKAKLLIADLVADWKLDLGTFAKKIDENAIAIVPENYITEFLSETHYLKSIQQWTPHLYEEIKGIAAGACQSLSTLLAINFMDEEWVFGLQQQLEKPRDKCTAFGMPHQKAGVSFAGQNMDIGSWSDGRQVLLRVMPHTVTYFGKNYLAPEALVFTNAGNIALNGINANGLGITCNTLPQLNYSQAGLPVSFIVRSVLEQPNMESAEQYLRAIEHASGQNYILSTHREMRCFECCGTSVMRYQPPECQGRVFHTNHPLINTDIHRVADLSLHRTNNSKSRFNAITSRLGNSKEIYGLAEIKAALSSHDDPDNPVSRNSNKEGNAIGFTAGSSIYELSDIPRLHLAAGPPCETEYQVFDFETV